MSYDELRYNLFLMINQNRTEEAKEFFEAMNKKISSTSSDLLKFDFSVDLHLNKFEWTPLHTAAYKGNAELVQYFLSKGADLSKTTTTGYTPVMLAEYKKNSNIVKLLMRDTSSSSSLVHSIATTENHSLLTTSV